MIGRLERGGETGGFTATGPGVSLPTTSRGRPARVLVVGAGTGRVTIAGKRQATSIGLPKQRRLVRVTSTDKKARTPATVPRGSRGLRKYDADDPIPREMVGQFDTIIVNNPYGYKPGILRLGEALRPGGRIIVQGRAPAKGEGGANKYFAKLWKQAIQNPSSFPGYRVIVDLLPGPPGRPGPHPGILGGPFQVTGGGRQTFPNARLIFERQLPPGSTTPRPPAAGAPPPPAAASAPKPAASSPTFHQRQRAAALRHKAGDVEATAAKQERNAAKIAGTRPAGARRAEARAAESRAEAARLRAEAEEFGSGRRSATDDLPGPEDIDAHFAALRPEQPLVRIGLNAAELGAATRGSSVLPRLARELAVSRSGNRVVFRVEGGGSRRLVHIDAHGNVSLKSGKTVHLNFGSLERAQEFLAKREPGSRIVAFEVEPRWVEAARSAAIPEGGTKALAGRQPRLVDVTYADDQLEVPGKLIHDLQEFILPRSGRSVEIKK